MMRSRTHDASLKHPRFGELARLARDGQCSEFQSAFLLLPMDERHVILSGLAESSSTAQEFERWAKQDSSTGSLVHGTSLITHAWRARTGLAGKYVAADAAKLFFEHLNESYEYLLAAHHAEPANPEPPARLIRVLMGLQAERRQIYDCYERLTATGQHHLAGGYHAVEALAPKWGGDQQEMLAFAHTQANTDPRNRSLIAYAHIENWVSERMATGTAEQYFKRPHVREEILEAYEADPARSAGDYFSVIARSVYALCFFKMADEVRTHRELFTIGDRYPSKPWVYVDGVERDAVNAAREWAGLLKL